MTFKTKAAICAAASAAALALSAAAPRAAAATVTSTFSVANGPWENPGSWTEAPANANWPNNFGATTFDAAIPTGNATLNASVTIQKFTLSGGSLSGTGTLNLNEPFTWTGGHLFGSNVINANGGFTLNAPAATPREFRGGAINVKAGTTAFWVSGSVSASAGTLFNNHGTFTVQFDGNFGGGGNSPTSRSTLNNFGLIQKNVGVGTSTIGWAVNNTGTVSVSVGTLRLAGGGTSTGTFTTGPLGTLEFAGIGNGSNGSTLLPGSKVIADKVVFASGFNRVQGAYDVTTSTTFGSPTWFDAAVTNPGATMTTTNGSVTFASPAAMTTSALNLQGGGLVLAGPLTVNTLINWQTGTLTGAGTVTANTTLTLAGTGGKHLAASLRNLGTATMSGTNLTLHNARIENQGTFNIAGDVDMRFFGQTSHLYNSGLFNKSAGTGVAEIQAVLHNTGTVSATIGTLRLAGGGTSSGRIAGPGRIDFAANFEKPDYDLTSTSTVFAANVTVSPGATVRASGTWGVGNTTVNGGTLRLSGTPNYPSGASLNVIGGSVILDVNQGSPAVANLSLVASGGNVQVLSFNQHLASIALSGNAVVHAPYIGWNARTIVTKALSIADGAKLDLDTNQLVHDYTGPAGPALAAVRAAVISGRNPNGAAWTGPGIISNAAKAIPDKTLGYGEAADVLGIAPGGTATWLGQTVDATSVLVRFTRYGDATLDGNVDFLDLVKLAQNYNTVDGSKPWSAGDFTYDGNVDFQDLVKLAQNYGQGVPGAPVPGAPADFQSDLAAAFASVPEPAALPALLLSACGLAGRRRRRTRA